MDLTSFGGSEIVCLSNVSMSLTVHHGFSIHARLYTNLHFLINIPGTVSQSSQTFKQSYTSKQNMAQIQTKNHFQACYKTVATSKMILKTEVETI